jgi:branched-subunit amino acid aminotransferase/4-amino-4-deoxychorismate lyase
VSSRSHYPRFLRRKAISIGWYNGRLVQGRRAAIMPQELVKADEVFLTGSAAEVTPVGEIIGEVGD